MVSFHRCNVWCSTGCAMWTTRQCTHSFLAPAPIKCFSVSTHGSNSEFPCCNACKSTLHHPRSSAAGLAAVQSCRHDSATRSMGRPGQDCECWKVDCMPSASPDAAAHLHDLSVASATSSIIVEGRHVASSKPQFNQAHMHFAQSRSVLFEALPNHIPRMMSASPNRQRSVMHLKTLERATRYIRDLYGGTQLYLCRQTNLCPIMLPTRLPSRS